MAVLTVVVTVVGLTAECRAVALVLDLVLLISVSMCVCSLVLGLRDLSYVVCLVVGWVVVVLASLWTWC